MLVWKFQPAGVCVPGVLDCGGAEFESDEEVYDAIGGVLQEVSADGKNEEDIRNICLQMFNTLKLWVEHFYIHCPRMLFTALLLAVFYCLFVF